MTAPNTIRSFSLNPSSDNYFTYENSIHINKLSNYNKLVNWVSGEFTLYLQEESEGIKVYFPNGWFVFEKGNKNGNSLEVKILVKSKSRKWGNRITAHLEDFVNYFNNFILHY